MQLNSVYLYPNKIDVFTNALASWQTERYRRVYNRNLKIYRSVDNRIDIQVRNSDQKAAAFAGATLVFNLITREGKDLVLAKDCTTLSATSGTAFINLTQEDLLNLEPGFYNYTVLREVRETVSETEYFVTSKTPLYQDSQYGVIGVIEVSGDVLGLGEPSKEITSYMYTNPDTTGYQDPSYVTFSNIDAKGNMATASTLHTFQFYHSTNYTGRIRIQGSLDAAAHPITWVDIADSAVTPGGNSFTTDGSTVTYKNVIGKYNWFRVISGASYNGSAKFVVGQTMAGNYNVSVYDGGKSYAIGQTLTITGDYLGGFSGVNDLNITVASVNYQGSVTGVTWTGTSKIGTRSFVLGATGESVVGSVDKVLYR